MRSSSSRAEPRLVEALATRLDALATEKSRAFWERFAQTGVGWLLRELADADRARVLAFTDAHLAEMSREAVRYVVEHMPRSVQARVLASHKSAEPSTRPRSPRVR